MGVWTLTTAAGGVAISVISLFCGLYLMYSLWHNGRGKLRVRLLMGIVSSDIIISLTALPTEALYVSGKPIITGSAGCDVQAFFFTAAVFAQNLWTLCIAVATFCLLKLPLHPFTTAIEKYAWTSWLLVWTLSFGHSALWLGLVGFANTSSTMCTYSSRHPHDLDRDLVQFVPRALVFVVLFGLYSRLFSFLRRPDTINLSSHHTSSVGSFTNGTVSAVQGTAKALRRASRSCVCGAAGHEDVDPAAPWEALEFCKVGIYEKEARSYDSISSPTTSFLATTAAVASMPSRHVSRSASPLPRSRATSPAPLPITPITSITPITPIIPITPITTSPTTSRSALTSLPVSSATTRVGSEPNTPTTLVNVNRPPTLDRARGSISAIAWNEKFFEPRGSVGSVTFSDDLDPPRDRIPRRLGRPSIIASSGSSEVAFNDPFAKKRGSSEVAFNDPFAKKRGSSEVAFNDPFAKKRDAEAVDLCEPQFVDPFAQAPSRSPSRKDDKGRPAPIILPSTHSHTRSSDSDSDDDGPTLTDFLRANAVDTGTMTSLAPSESATAYFNRQASLLMLWFPLAYMFNFSITLVRLVYDMSASKPSPALALLSSWMTLSVGLFDTLVFGLAEYVVRRRVRKKMPHQLGSTTGGEA